MYLHIGLHTLPGMQHSILFPSLPCFLVSFPCFFPPSFSFLFSGRSLLCPLFLKPFPSLFLNFSRRSVVCSLFFGRPFALRLGPRNERTAPAKCAPLVQENWGSGRRVWTCFPWRASNGTLAWHQAKSPHAELSSQKRTPTCECRRSEGRGSNALTKTGHCKAPLHVAALQAAETAQTAAPSQQEFESQPYQPPGTYVLSRSRRPTGKQCRNLALGQSRLSFQQPSTSKSNSGSGSPSGQRPEVSCTFILAAHEQNTGTELQSRSNMKTPHTRKWHWRMANANLSQNWADSQPKRLVLLGQGGCSCNRCTFSIFGFLALWLLLTLHSGPAEFMYAQN